LQDLVLVHGDGDGPFEIADDLDLVPGDGALVQAQCVFEEIDGVERFDDAGDAGVILLHGHDFLDMVDVAGKLIDLFLKLGVLLSQMSGKGGEIAGQFASTRIVGKEGGQIILVFLEERGGLAQVGHAGLAHLFADDGGGDVDAIEDIADVVQDAAAHFRHASHATNWRWSARRLCSTQMRSNAPLQ